MLFEDNILRSFNDLWSWNIYIRYLFLILFVFLFSLQRLLSRLMLVDWDLITTFYIISSHSFTSIPRVNLFFYILTSHSQKILQRVLRYCVCFCILILFYYWTKFTLRWDVMFCRLTWFAFAFSIVESYWRFKFIDKLFWESKKKIE